MLIIGIDPGISGSLCFFEDGKIIDVIEKGYKMGIQTKGKTIIVEEETYKLTKQDIEFLLNIVENSMVPGKYIGLANHVIGKLRNQYKISGKSEFQIKQAMIQERRREALKAKNASR